MALSFDKVSKVITVLAPDTEITIQNLLNSIREYEDELSSMDIPIIVSCAGKEPLGGGVAVGLTLTLLDDWQLAFEARSGPDYIQCTVAGGNIVAVNILGSIYPTAFTQVLITASSSATQSDLAAIQYASYGGRVSMDVTTLQTGINYPSGNVEHPVNNFADTILIANSKGFTDIEVREPATLNTGDFSGFHIYGKSHVNTALTVASPANVANITLTKFHLSGVLDGGTEVSECVIGDILYFNGHIHDSSLGGILTLDGAAESFISNCTRLEDETMPVINFNNGDNHLVLSNYTGMIEFINMSAPGTNALCGVNQGIIILDSATCIAGTVSCIGIGFLKDELGNDIPTGTWNGMTINNMLMSNQSVADTVLDAIA